ncbi:MAG: PAS domain-containing protein, partial [Candidatus Eremiobacteraeota bacterium]|nr:PAS domain-containing protein [Candidatus Eremiobacteraeota bacterium]
FPAPIVIAQHADPKGSGRLAEILRRQTRLRIDTVPNEDDELRPGHLYLAPPGRNLTIKGTRVYSSERQKGHPVPSIDLLFTTAAQAFGDRVVAVILTGMGTDGVAGVRAVKEHGGTVVVQEIGSAAYPALPAAIPTPYVDFTSTIDELPSLLTTLVSPGDGNLGTDGQQLDAFLAQVRGRSGIDFRQYKMPTIRRRLMRLMAAANCSNLAEYLRYLNTHPDAYQRLVSSFLIKVTGFFRDPPLYRYLQENVLPDIIKQSRETQSELRLWSAGSATGEEAYSLAIILAELLGDDVERLPIRIFATDLDAHAIDFARRGVYPAAAFEDMPPELIAKYFTNVDSAYQVKKKIRNLTVFGEYDLGQRAPFPRIDLVMCRNVMIYFTKELQQRTLQLFAFSLRQGGYLVLGKAETVSPLPQYFAPVHSSVKVYRRQGERLLIPAPVIVDGLRMPERPSLRRAALRSSPQRRASEESLAPRWSLVDRLGAFLFESDIGVVVVDRHYDIVTINQAARNLLGIAGQGIGDDLIHLAQTAAGELKPALDAAFRGEMPGGGIESTVRDPGEDEERFLTINCYPDRAASKEGRTEGVIVTVTDSTRMAKRVRFLEKEYEHSKLALSTLSLHNDELAERQRALMQANGELSAANLDLRNANEHLMISAEEAEASAEEVETLNEEMQATSEELETLNEELHATVEELNTTNEELGARTADLERAAKDRQNQLDNANAALSTLRAVVSQLPLIVCIVDRRSTVALASERYMRLSGTNDDLLPPIGEKWRLRSEKVTLHEDGTTTAYGIVQIPLPENGGEAMLLLTPLT